MQSFPTNSLDIEQRLHSIKPFEYGKSRNFINGSVTYLSPYISRGVLTTKGVFDYIRSQQYSWKDAESLIRELAWRDFFQHTWNQLGNRINNDIYQEQTDVIHHSIPKGIVQGTTGIQGIDNGIHELYKSGYMHNHVRMYTASITCNIAKYHWKKPAQWMYYHLFDADWASNACSWQWVAGSFSNKRYYANQENINTYCITQQRNTFLDTNYENLPLIYIPDSLNTESDIILSTNLPSSKGIENINSSIPTLLYNWYNLDFSWHDNLEANRILLLEPSVFSQYPISDGSMKFMMDIAVNIPHIIIFQGEFSELKSLLQNSECIYKQHPLQDYSGKEEQREMMIPITDKNFRSFFSFWKYHEAEVKRIFES